MATVKAFRAIRPVPELAGRVAASYDVMDSNEAREMVKAIPIHSSILTKQK